MKFDYVQQIFFFSVLVATTGTFIWMLGSYLYPVLWGTIITLIFYPFYQKALIYTGQRPSVAAFLSVFTVILLVLVPLIFIGGMIVQDSIEMYQRISQDENFAEESLLNRAQEFITYLEPYGISEEVVIERIREGVGAASQFLSSSLVAFSQVTLTLGVYIAIMLYLMFFMFRDGEKILKTFWFYLPLNRTYEERLSARFTETARAVVKGTLAIALLQGVIIGLVFWALGISSPILWASVVSVLALIPAVGPAIVWLPAGIILIATGSLWSGVIVLFTGVILVGLVDEFLRPILVGRGAKMPDAIVLLATIGGLASFGISGFVLGPIIAALFLSLWSIFGERYSKELSAKDAKLAKAKKL